MKELDLIRISEGNELDLIRISEVNELALVKKVPEIIISRSSTMLNRLTDNSEDAI